MPSFIFRSLSLGMTSKIPTEDYCAGMSAYGELFNAVIELVFQFKKMSDPNILLMLVHQKKFKAWSCWKNSHHSVNKASTDRILGPPKFLHLTVAQSVTAAVCQSP